ncbi:hypothetical protein LNP27_09210 [Flavobacterium galactosidilyticum]|uniref:SMODS-associated NUDIX domain-containing protein n=1 Tax=Flavobacterium galactosidilyticum TaxID=2893886 RepID=UPI001E2DA976|nr:hypothetical protein [Flavobacterium sp. F-340]UFH45312.1 hypothetical protein LNP27_09210 [Flavobacterium sp. F-340]
MIRRIIQTIIAIGFIIYGYFQMSGSEYQKDVVIFGVIGLATLMELLIEHIFINSKRLYLLLQIYFLALKGEKIRFSMSYLYIIKIDDEYLLVKNSNYGHYQLVGGKYKRLEGTQSLLKEKFEAIDDLKLPNKDLMKDDFAIFIPAKNAIKFLDWFNEGQNREINHWREFYEELIEGKAELLSKENFPYVNYNLLGRVTTPVKRTAGWNCPEILQYDILELLPNVEQRKELLALKNQGDTEYIKWVDRELIDCLGHDKRTKKKLYDIGQHTKWALNMKWSKE